MGLVSRIFCGFLLLCGCAFNAVAQVNINFSISPPFTPFISDYIQPQRLEDINVSLFNTGTKSLNLKFKISLVNASKGISVVLKDNISPVTPIVLNASELKFLTLADVGTNYGKLDQTAFTATGINLQSAVLDGTLPDGLYEICIQAFDFDAVGFTKPLSNGSPTGCFSFQVNYTDPPTDIRLNGNLINYTYRGTVPFQGFNSSAGQNFVINFTPPNYTPGSNYQYTLYLYDENMFNPSIQQEARILEAINTLIPTISKTSFVPSFFIDPSDPLLRQNRNYFLVIKAEDLANKTVFKNNGFSSVKAFNLFDNTPNLLDVRLTLPKPCGSNIINLQSIDTIDWFINGANTLEPYKYNDIGTRVKVVVAASSLIPSGTIMNSTVGQTIIDTTFFSDQNIPFLKSKLSIVNKLKSITDTANKKFIISVQLFLKPSSRFQGLINFNNNGLPLDNCEYTLLPPNPKTTNPINSTVPVVIYPVENDTLPFHYIPIVVQMPVTTNTKIAFSQFDSDLEPLECYKYLKLTTDVTTNNQLNGLSLDSTLKRITTLLNSAADLQLRGRDIQANALLSQAQALVLANSFKAKVMLNHAIGMKQLPMGNSAKGKYAIARAALNYDALNQGIGNATPFLNFPNLEKMIYLQPYKNTIMWTGKVGLYDVVNNGGMSMATYETKFIKQTFTKTEQNLPMVKNTYRTFSGIYNVGMKRPVLTATKGMVTTPGKITLSFLPSRMPQQLLPTLENNNAWYDFDSFFVAQQWNVEISRFKNFRKLDTVISNRIIKNYAVAKGTVNIIKDLYTSVSVSVNLKDTGTFYWRVTWSNVTLDTQKYKSQIPYWRRLSNQIANSQLLGQNPDVNFDKDSFFFKRTNYLSSAIDSIKVKSPVTKPVPPTKPNFELIYPLPGDTVPFQFPPVVFKNNSVDNDDKFLLSNFTSDLEPLPVSKYLIIQKHPSSDTLLNLSYDSLSKLVSKELNDEANQQLLGNEGNLTQVISNAEARLGKRLYLQIIDSVYGISIYPMGNNDTFKYRIMRNLFNRSADLQKLGLDAGFNPDDVRYEKMLYLKPYKTVNWKSSFAFYNTTKQRGISVKNFEDQFVNNPTFASTGSLSGNFNVGMKQPEIVTYYNGKNVPINNIIINFRPSRPPSRLIPNFESDRLWMQFKKLLVAQQWNIEVSKTPSFDTIIYRKSKKIIDYYSLPGSVDKMMNDLYNQRNEKLDLKNKGKFYYRITWSNPVNFDTLGRTSDSVYMKMYDNIAFEAIRNGNLDTIVDYIDTVKNAISVIQNYLYSAVDSFNVIDTLAIVKNDTAICGLDCNFDLAGVSMTPMANHIAINDTVLVGRFKMKVTQITFAGNQASGKGLIFNRLISKNVKVVFTNVQINAAKRLIVGNVLGEISQNSGFTTGPPLVDQAKNLLQDKTKSEELYNYINSPLALAGQLISDQPVSLPYGLSKEVDNFPSTIAFTDMIFTPTRATLNAIAVLRWEYEGKKEFFGFTGRDFCMNEKGLGGASNGFALELVGDLPIPISDSLVIKIIGKRGLDPSLHCTRIEWDCKGLKDIALVASVTLPRSMFIPENSDNTIARNGQVTGTVEVNISSLQNFLLSVSFDKSFQFSTLPNFSFEAKTVTVDMSDYVNPDGIQFPAGFNGERSNAWRGIYIGRAEIKLPEAFSNKNNPGTRLGFNAQNLMIDQSGFTANVGVDNILGISDGDVGGWKLSIGRVGINIVNNTLSSCALSGLIGVPLFTGEIAYSLALSPNLNKDSTVMNFTLTPNQDLSMQAWFAMVTLANTSTIKLGGAITNINSWKISSNFNGTFSLGADDMAGVKNVRLGSLPFEGLTLSSYVNNLDSFKFNLDKLGGIKMNRVIQANPASGTPAPAPEIPSTETQEVAAFPIGITDFSLDVISGKPCMFEIPGVPAQAIRIGIKFKINLNLSEGEGDEKNGLSGSCGLGMYAYMQNLSDLLSFRPAGINVDTIKIDLEVGGVATVRGAILFMANDPVFGNGFQGMAEATFEPAFNGSVSAIFGEKDGERYFMFDAQIGFKPGIPIDFTVGAIFANSFGGGIWYKMKMTPGNVAAAGAKLTLGKSASGNSFVPDKTKSLGFEARLGLTGPPGTPVYGQVTLAAEFSDQWSLDMLSFGGNLWFTQEAKSKAEVFIAGRVTIDLKESKLLGSLGALVNVANGTVRGRTETKIGGTSYYIAGEVDLLVDFPRQKWHINIGNPYTNSRLGFGFYAGKTQLFEAGGYFVMGNDLPGKLPPVKPELATSLSMVGLNVPNDRAIPSSDSAFAILAGIDAAIPEKRVELGMFYAGISFAFAVDGILEEKTQSCPRDGFKGWYVTGKAYAAINGALGLKVSTPFFTGDVIAGEINAGAILDAGFANPYYIMGQFAASYSVFGGLFEGSQSFNFEVLEDPNCRPVLKSTLVYGQIVSDHTPAPTTSGSITTDVSVGVEPIISLTYKLNSATQFEFPATVVVKGRNVDTILTKHIRVVMDSCAMKMVDNKNKRYPIVINSVVSSDEMDLRLKPLAYLKDKRTKYEVKAVFHMEERMKGSNSWNRVKRTIAGKSVDWDTVVTYQFTTELDASFNSDFVLYSNPKKGERYYKKFPTKVGKIVTDQIGVQATFFDESTPSDFRPYYEYYMECSPAGNMADTFRRSLSFNNNEITFELPNSKLENEGYYQIRIIRLYHSNLVLNTNSRFENADITSSNINNNNGPRFDGSKNLGTERLLNDAQIRMRQRKSGNAIEARLIMHTINFAVSKYNNMSDKIEQLQLPPDRRKVPFSGDVVTLSFDTDEPFEQYEIKADTFENPNGNSLTILKPSIVMKNYRDEATLNNWYKNYYRGTIFNAFDTLIKKFASLSNLRTAGNQFNTIVNISTKVDGMEVAMDNHITKPFSYNSMMWDYRLAQINYSSLFTRFHDLEFLSNTTLDLTNLSVSNSTIDPLTGTRRNGPPINVNTPPPPPPQPVNGSRLTLQFKNYDLAVQQFDQLSRLGQFIYSSCSPITRSGNTFNYYQSNTFPPKFIANLSLMEHNLVEKVRNPSRFVLQGATDMETFNVDFHISNTSTIRNTATFSNSEIFGLRPAMIIIYTTN